ncbi:MAG: amidohydrolase [Candidatus Tectimicrobiota bacterium]|nr:MAG: amidohydrolase [Candidatus Tectomicrobia bacterium]
MRHQAALEAFLATLPVLDGHCHPPRRQPPASAEAFQRFFSESDDPQLAARHVPHSLFFQHSLQQLATLLDTPAEVAALLERRQALGLRDYLHLLVQRSNLRGLLVDDGYRPEASYTCAELQALLAGTSCRVWRVLRLETLAEQLLAAHPDFAAFLDAYRAALQELRAQGIVALKSIIAYRTGLAVEPPDAKAAAQAFAQARQALARDGRVRLAHKPLLDFLLAVALEAAAQQGLPVQLHTGFGDPDLDLLQSNPLLLRPLLHREPAPRVPLVLLHAYPYLREAAYLSSVYANVYVDLSLAFPMLHLAAERALEEVLGLAPVSKVLYGSDAAGLPDWLWLGVLACRRALARLLAAWVEAGLPEAQARAVAEAILYANGCALYGVPLDPLP